MDCRRTLLTLTTLLKSLIRLICKQAKRPLHLLLTIISRLIGVHSSATQGRRTAGDDDDKDPQPKSIDSAQEQDEKPFNDLSADSCGGNGVENNISRFYEENVKVSVFCPSYDPLPGPYPLSGMNYTLEGCSHDHPTRNIADSGSPQPRCQNEAGDSGQHSQVLPIQSLGGHVRRTSGSSTGTLIEVHPLHDLQIFGEAEGAAKETINRPHIEVTVGGEDEGKANVVIELGDPQDRLCAEPVREEEEGISPFIYPIMPKDIRRYARERMIEEVIPHYDVQPRQIEFLDAGLPLGWEKITCPEGFPYFWHPEDRILTDNWLPDPEVASHLHKFVEDIKEFLRKENLQQTNEVHLVLDVVREEDPKYPDDPEKDKWWCGYYYVNHTERSIFWQESLDIWEYLDEVKGDLAPSHVKLYLETQYWQHWDFYPDVCPVSHEVLRRYEDTVRDAQADVLTSSVATMNLSFEELDHMMAIMQQAKDAIIQDGKSAHDGFWTPSMSTWFIGRFMQIITKSHFVNFYGQPCCRLDTRMSVHGHTPGHKLKDFSLMFRILSPLLFCAPDVHLVTMNELWVDQLTLDKPWKRLFDRLYDDWKAQLVYASLLLTSNIAFLAVPTVTSQDVIVHGTSVQVPSYVSSICSAASILLGLLLSRQHQNRGTSARDIHEWLMKRRHPTRGLEPLAVMFSLPFALLMWGMVTFLIGFTIFCFQNTTIGARVSAGFFWLAVTALVMWYIWMSWDNTTDRWSSTVEHLISPGSFWDKHLLTPIKSRSSRGSTRSERTRWKKMKKLLKRRKNAQPSINSTNGTQSINDPTQNV